MTSPPPQNDPDRLRAGNADRERVVQRLNDAFAEGRLDVHELDERVAAAYAAKTVGDLQPLLADLPGSASPAPWRPAGQPPAGDPTAAPYHPARVPGHPRGTLARKALRANFRAWLTAVLINVVIWAVVCLGTGGLVYFWPIWVAGPWGALLLAQAITFRSSDDPHRREQ